MLLTMLFLPPTKYNCKPRVDHLPKNNLVHFLYRILPEIHRGGDAVRLDCDEKPEFTDWQWVSYWYPISSVVDFKQQVYRSALSELSPLTLPSSGGKQKSNSRRRRRKR